MYRPRTLASSSSSWGPPAGPSRSLHTISSSSTRSCMGEGTASFSFIGVSSNYSSPVTTTWSNAPICFCLPEHITILLLFLIAGLPYQPFKPAVGLLMLL